MCVYVRVIPCGMIDGPFNIKEAASRSSLRPDMYLLEKEIESNNQNKWLEKRLSVCLSVCLSASLTYLASSAAAMVGAGTDRSAASCTPHRPVPFMPV